jgi:hypothetical protein
MDESQAQASAETLQVGDEVEVVAALRDPATNWLGYVGTRGILEDVRGGKVRCISSAKASPGSYLDFMPEYWQLRKVTPKPAPPQVPQVEPERAFPAPYDE